MADLRTAYYWHRLGESFWAGLVALVPAPPKYPSASDWDALAADWRTVGADLAAASMKKMQRERGE